jgi:4-hydroxybenzoyl-CoA reductase subunit beta
MSMQLPPFDYLTPTTIEDAAGLLADTAAVLVGGGTDLFPKMKRRQMTPPTLVSLSKVPELRGVYCDDGGSCIIGASTTLKEIETSPLTPPMLASAAREIASPQIRNTGTVGGNLCLDTRCNYIDMPELWREASGHCLKDGGDTCWVAPRSNHCWAISSSDLAPAAIALDASVRLVSSHGNRSIRVEDLYNNDGIAYQTKSADEILVELVVPPFDGESTYRKLRRRGSIDFPLVSVAATARFDDDDACTAARIVIGAVASAPIRAIDAEQFLVGKRLNEETIEEAAQLASQPVRPQDNTDTGSRYRKWMTPVYVSRALRDLVVTDS